MIEQLNDVIIETIPLTKEEKAERAKWAAEAPTIEKEMAAEARRQAYVRISDPVYMQYARGVKTKQDWLDAVAQVEADYPIPGEGDA